MNRELFVSALAALGCHTLLLFGLRMERPAVPLPIADTEIEVGLVEAAPPSAAPPPAEVSPPLPPVPDPVAAPPVPEPIGAPRPAATDPKPPVAETPRSTPPRPAKPGPLRTAPPSGTGTAADAPRTVPGNTKPRYRSNPRPAYPVEARRQNQQGRVVLEVEVSSEGRPTSVALKHSCGFPSLDSAALAAVRRWTFDPARTAGVPVAARVEVPVQFDLAR